MSCCRHVLEYWQCSKCALLVWVSCLRRFRCRWCRVSVVFLFIYFIILVIFVERGWNGSTTRRRRGGSGKRFFVRVGDGLLPFIMVAVRKVAKLVVIDCARERKRDRCVIHRLWSPNSNKKYSIFEHKWQQNLDLPMQCERSTISRQLKFGRRLRVSLTWKVWDARRNSLDVRRI